MNMDMWRMSLCFMSLLEPDDSSIDLVMEESIFVASWKEENQLYLCSGKW